MAPPAVCLLRSDFGFDPLGLGSDPELLAKCAFPLHCCTRRCCSPPRARRPRCALQATPLALSHTRPHRFRENEVIHGRWAMLGAAGIIAVEATGAGNWIDAQTWPITGGKPSYLGNQVGVSDPLLLVAFELAALGFVEKLRGAESGEKRIYPGGSFDPMGMSKDAKAFEEAKLKEIKNGRLAMIACMGMFSQGAVTHDGVLTALGKHLANPWGYNVATSNSIASA